MADEIKYELDDVLAVLNEVKAEHPEYEPACDLILEKLTERLAWDVDTMRHSLRIADGPKKPQ